MFEPKCLDREEFDSPILIAEHPPVFHHARRSAVTEEQSGRTPVLVQNVERVCEIDTAPSETSAQGLYGNRFQSASPETVKIALRSFSVPTRTNLIAMAAPVGRGRYSNEQIRLILMTALTEFRAAVLSSVSHPVDVHTGFWVCGAFGGNRTLMVLLQLLAARLAEVDNLIFHLGSVSEEVPFEDGQKILNRLSANATSLGKMIDRIDGEGFKRGFSDEE